MEVTISLKCDRSGRVVEKKVDSSEVEHYESRQRTREETLTKIAEFIDQFPAEDLPDLFAMYRGEPYVFINVSDEYCGKPVRRLLGQLFHASDPKSRKSRKKKEGVEELEVEPVNETEETKETEERPGIWVTQESIGSNETPIEASRAS